MTANPANANPRESLAGWRYHPKAARILLATLMVGCAAPPGCPRPGPSYGLRFSSSAYSQQG
jgi:hypothetical protein